MADFYLNSNYKFKIGELEGTLHDLGAGLSSVDVTGNEEVDQTPYLDGSGFGTSDVTGGQPVYTFEGHRLYGDDAQDFIFGKRFTFGKDRRCEFEVEDPDGATISGEATLVNIDGPGGEANAKSEISFEVHFVGLPTLTPAPE